MKTKLSFLFVALIATTALWAQNNIITYTATSKLTETKYWGAALGLHTNAFNVSISSHIFNNGTGTITFSGEVTTIGSSAFYECSGLISITIPNSVTTIGDYAFYECSGLTSVTIPSSVTTIGDYAFSGVNNIVYGGTAAGSPWDAKCVNGYVDGYLVYEDATKTILCGCSSAATGEITIPNSVTTIGEKAFYNCSSLTSVTIPNSVISIGSRAFYNCSSLTSVTIPSFVTTIGDYAFYNVNNIVYSGTATGSPWGAKCLNGYVDGYLVYSDATKTTLCGCSSAVTGEIVIPNSVTTIGDCAFYNCSGLTSVTIPSSVTTIGEYAFYGCSGLKSVTIPNSVTTIGGDAFYGCTSLTSITIPHSVTRIGGSAFWDCSGLTSVTIPSSVKTIESSAFEGCYGLQKTNYTGTIADWCKISFKKFSFDYSYNSNPISYSHNFYINDVEIKDLVIPESVDKIGSGAFYNCVGLKSVTIPNSVTTIGEKAFYGCSGLTSVTIPNSVTMIGSSAFEYCSFIEKVYVYVPHPYPFETEDPVVIVNPIITKAFTATTPQYILQNVAHISTDNTPTCVFVHVDLSKMETSQYAKLALDFAGTKYELSTKESTVVLTGLNPASTNQATFYSQLIGEFEWREGATIEVTTPALTLTTLTPKVVSAGNVVVAASTNISDLETNVGFEWRKYNAPPELPSSRAHAILYSGQMEGILHNLSLEYWKVRAYYEAADGTCYYGEWATFDPSQPAFFEPTVHTYALVTDPTANKVQMRGYVMTGTDEVTEQGFEYWFKGAKAPRRVASATPDSVYRVQASGQVMTAVLEDLAYSTTYTCRAYAVAGGKTYYGEEVQFLTPEDPRPIYTLYVMAGENGSVNTDVSGQYREGETVTLTATPEQGFRFKQWSDGNTDNPRQLTIMAYTELMAFFELADGLEDIRFDQFTDSPVHRFTKIIKDNHLLIFHNGKTYNALGGRVK